ncbi:MAG: glycoside hydrolase family 5 protein [Cyclobacteriaceae bacterium]
MKLKAYFISLILIISAASELISSTPVELNGALSIDGIFVKNEKGEIISLAGPSLFWSNVGWGGDKFYNEEVVKRIAIDWKANIIRVPMGVDANGGYLDHPSNYQKVKTVIEAAISAGIYVIVDWHSHHAEDHQQEAIDFFSELAKTYGNHPNIIYEVYNEPLSVSWSDVIKPYAEKVIDVIRKHDPDNIIVVGTPHWSQDIDVASKDPISGYKNIAYALHFYAGSHSRHLREKAETAISNGIAIIVTEWGTVNANGDGAIATSSVNEWLDFMRKHNISHCNWALNDKAEGASSLIPKADTLGRWSNSDLTESGVMIKKIISKWNTYEN